MNLTDAWNLFFNFSIHAASSTTLQDRRVSGHGTSPEETFEG